MVNALLITKDNGRYKVEILADSDELSNRQRPGMMALGYLILIGELSFDYMKKQVLLGW